MLRTWNTDTRTWNTDTSTMKFFFGEGRLKDAGAIQKDLQLHNVNIASYYTDKYALWLDFRTIDDNRLHGSGRRLENTSEGICFQITKKAGAAGKLSCYLFIFQDAQSIFQIPSF